MARTPTRLGTAQRQLLEQVATATQERNDAIANYEEAVLAAYNEGVPITHIAQAVGVSNETTRKFIHRRLKHN